MGRKIKSLKPGCHFCFAGYTVKFNDGPNLYILYKDIFVNGIYHFDAARPDPLILDCGSNIGMSILYFKQKYLSRDAEKKDFLLGWNLRQRPCRNPHTGEISCLETIRSSVYAPAGLFA